MQTKRQQLGDFCQTALELHQAGLNVETRFRRAVAPDTSRRDRIAVMGDPTYYLEVLNTGTRDSTVDIAGGAAFQYLHTFQVSLFLAYDDNDDYAQSSQSTWDAMIEGTDTPPGLLVAVDTEVVLGTGADRVGLRHAEEVADDVIPLDLSSTEAAHLLTFTVQIEG